LAAYSEGAMTLNETIQLPVYLRKKLIDKYEAEKEKEANNGYQVTKNNG